MILQSHHLIGTVDDKRIKDSGDWKILDVDFWSKLSIQELLNPKAGDEYLQHYNDKS